MPAFTKLDVVYYPGPNNDLESLIGFRDTGKSSYYIAVLFVALIQSFSLYQLRLRAFSNFSSRLLLGYLLAFLAGPSKTYYTSQQT